MKMIKFPIKGWPPLPHSLTHSLTMVRATVIDSAVSHLWISSATPPREAKSNQMLREEEEDEEENTGPGFHMVDHIYEKLNVSCTPCIYNIFLVRLTK